MPRITYAEQNGTKHEIELQDGTSVMQGAVENSVPGIDGDCGGIASENRGCRECVQCLQNGGQVPLQQQSHNRGRRP
jgi:hypothetical protein